MTITLHRRPKRLPNPLDFETCHVTRLAYRRQIAQLVETTLVTPALEIFADRQPVQWGVTEVVEQSLVACEPLPESWKFEATSEPLVWLEPSVSTGVINWHLIVEPADAMHRSFIRSADVADAIVWIDHDAMQ